MNYGKKFNMKYVHELYTEQYLPIPEEEAWKFFSSPKNLAKITPPELDFKILTNPLAEDIYDGMEIEYTIKPVLRIPIRWKTRLLNIQNNKRFTDIQLRGPYKIWEHTHTFEKTDKGVLMKDFLKYKLPMGFIGNFIHSIYVKRKVQYIFKYREETLKKLFS